MLGAEELNRLRVLLNRAFSGRGNAVNGAQMVWREHYTYDGNGNLIHEAGTRRQAAYEYNGQNRMVYAEVRNASEQVRSRYGYDGLGRRTVVQDEGGGVMRTLYDGVRFEVIREGETFNDGTFTTQYSQGHMTTTNPGTEGSRYRWVSEGEAGIRTQSTGEGSTTTARYVGISVTLYGNGEPVAVSRSASEGSRGGPVYLGKDILGSIKTTTNEYGSLEERYEYDAFGKPYTGDLTQGMNLGYTGKPYDTVTGLYNYGYRDYKPETARFTTIDPIRDGSNWFAYVNNDPVNWIDPWGLDKVLTIYNTDPTPGANIIISDSGNVGHTWMNIEGESRGWGYSGLIIPDSGNTVSGALLDTESDNRWAGQPTSSYTKTITDEQAQDLTDYWDNPSASGTGYNLGGRAYDQNSTMCTEAVIEALNKTGVLTPAESAIINSPYEKWGNSVPDPTPSSHQAAKDKFQDLTSPNPNEFEKRMGQLNNNRNCND